jgi:hypothetical protein
VCWVAWVLKRGEGEGRGGGGRETCISRATFGRESTPSVFLSRSAQFFSSSASHSP